MGAFANVRGNAPAPRPTTQPPARRPAPTPPPPPDDPVDENYEQAQDNYEEAPAPPPQRQPSFAQRRPGPASAPRGPRPVDRQQPARAARGGSSMFSGIRDARSASDVNYARAGTYLCRIDRCKTGVTRKRIEFTAIEMTIIHVYDDAEGKGHRLGETVTAYYGSDNDYFLSEIKGFIAALLDANEDEIDEDDCFEMVSDEQPFAGMTIVMKNRDKRSQTPPHGVYTLVRYENFPADRVGEVLTEDEIARFFPQ